MKVIMSVPDEGYYERTWWRLLWASPDEGYYECTWWRLFQKRIVRTKFDIYVSFTAIGHLKLNERQNMFIKWYFLQEKSYVYLIFKQNESYDTRKQTEARNTSGFCLD
jgi:hypothetical protein